MSGKMARRKGQRWERDCRNFFDGWVDRFTHIGTDEPDIVLKVGDKRILVECKNQARLELPKWYLQAKGRDPVEREGCRAVVLHKRPLRPGVEDAWVTMSGEDFLWFLQQMHRNE